MTAKLAKLAEQVPLPAEPGVSVRTCRAVLRTLAQLADPSGDVPDGVTVSMLADLCETSQSTVKRAQRHLIRHGLLERAEVGGGRASTRWRILTEALTDRRA